MCLCDYSCTCRRKVSTLKFVVLFHRDLVYVDDCQTLWHFITSEQEEEKEILKCKFDNLLEITITALIFQSMFLVANVKPSRKLEKC